MAPANGRESTGLSADLVRAPHRFDFFQAVRLLELLARETARADARRPSAPVGHDAAPAREAVRFRTLPALSFPSAPVSKVEWPAADADRTVPPAAMVVAFLGLAGPLGVLPQHYTALLLRRVRGKDFSLRDFLDLLNHRAVSLFYRAWEKYRLPFTYERAQRGGGGPAGDGEDFTAWCLYCLAGFGTDGLRGRLAVEDQAFLYFAGHFAHYPRSASALEGILTDYFGLRVEVLQGQGQWLVLDPDDQSALPGERHRAGLNCHLGVDVIVGERIWDVQGKFRLRLGPLHYSQFLRFMPDGDGLRALCQLTRAYVGPEFDFDVQLLLQRDEVPPCRVTADPPEPARLGWNTWAGGYRRSWDVEDVVFSCDLAERGPRP